MPAVLYGRQIKPQNLEVEQVAFRNLIKHSASENILLDLSLTEDSRPKRLVLVKEIQHHPLSGRLLHVDLHEVSETEKVTIMVPVESVGESVGVKTDGGVLEHVLFKIKVRALPKDLPEVIEVDVSALKIGDSIHLGDIKAPEGVEVIGDKTYFGDLCGRAAYRSAGSRAGSGSRCRRRRSGDAQREEGRRRRRRSSAGSGQRCPGSRGRRPGQRRSSARQGCSRSSRSGRRRGRSSCQRRREESREEEVRFASSICGGDASAYLLLGITLAGKDWLGSSPHGESISHCGIG